MRTRSEESPPRHEDRDRQPGSRRREEPRNFETPGSRHGSNDDAPFGANGEPIPQEEINTNGSER
jgi:hypothetical protein